MSFGKWSTLAIVLMTLASAPLAQGDTLGRILNGDCEEVGDDPTIIPSWTRDSPRPTSARLDGRGVDGSDACLVIGTTVLRSTPFTVTAGEELLLEFDVNELRGDDFDQDDGDGGDLDDHMDADSVLALQFFDVDGRILYTLDIHCDEYVFFHDGDGDAIPAGEDASETPDTCTQDSGYHRIVIPDRNATGGPGNFEPTGKYADPIIVPAGALYGQILIAGDLVSETLDPTITQVGASTPTSITLFDNIEIDNP